VADIPDGMNVCHNCPGGDNPLCVNPDHLWLGTQKDNVHDCMRKRRLKNRTSAPGDRNPNAKVTEATVREIRRLSAVVPRWPLKQMQQKFGLSRSQIQKIIRGDAWAHIDNDGFPVFSHGEGI
jgi:hypothetical protein